MFSSLWKTIFDYEYGDLCQAISAHDFERVKWLIERKANVNEICWRSKQTALMIACHQGLSDIAICLIDAKADVNFQGPGKNTALMNAVNTNLFSVVTRLINAKADVNNRNVIKFTPLLRACDRSEMNRDIISLLITAKANVDAADEWGNTPLLYVCGLQHNYCSDTPKETLIQVAKNLLMANADVNSENFDNLSPLSLAIKSPEMTLLLIKYNCAYERWYESNEVVQRALSFNYPQHRQRFEFSLSNTYLLNLSNYARVKTLFLLRQCHSLWQLLPIELMEHILMHFFL